mmetsp:Transcript_44100/g.94537  ORF Transcript_44100/g.94537 Transcript_44100/m.94537 type:complete len:231 (+) Transcript_44100:1893-2585(+)
MATLRSDVGVVLGTNGAVLPTIPLSGASPWRLTWIGQKHALPNDCLHSEAAQLQKPPDAGGEKHALRILPGCQIDLGQGVGVVELDGSAGGFVPQLLLRLRGCDEVHHMLERNWKPRWMFTGSTVVEQPSSSFFGLVAGPALGGLGDGVHAVGHCDVQDDDECGDHPGDVDESLVHSVPVHHRERDGSEEGPSKLDREGAPMLREDVDAEDDPIGSTQPSSTHYGAPEHA